MSFVVCEPMCGGSPSGEDTIDLAPKRRRIDGWIAIQIRFYTCEQFACRSGINQLASEHGLHVGEILCVPSLHLRQRLGVQVVVKEVDDALALDEPATIAPAWKLGDKVGQCREFDVDF